MELRIAIAIDEHGCWSAYGGGDYDVKDAINEAIGHIHEDVPSKIYIATVNVPLPGSEDLSIEKIAPVESKLLEDTVKQYYTNSANIIRDYGNRGY